MQSTATKSTSLTGSCLISMLSPWDAKVHAELPRLCGEACQLRKKCWPSQARLFREGLRPAMLLLYAADAFCQLEKTALDTWSLKIPQLQRAAQVFQLPRVCRALLLRALLLLAKFSCVLVHSGCKASDLPACGPLAALLRVGSGKGDDRDTMIAELLPCFGILSSVLAGAWIDQLHIGS